MTDNESHCATHNQPEAVCDHEADKVKWGEENQPRCEHGVSLKVACAECQIPV